MEEAKKTTMAVSQSFQKQREMEKKGNLKPIQEANKSTIAFCHSFQTDTNTNKKSLNPWQKLQKSTQTVSHSFHEQEDRLNKLPEDLRIHILSFLDVKFAVQTSILSKQWKLLWTLIPRLNFDSSLFKQLPLFRKLVNKFLTIRDSSIRITHLNLMFNSSCMASGYNIVDRITDYALSHGVLHLSVYDRSSLRTFNLFNVIDLGGLLQTLELESLNSFIFYTNTSILSFKNLTTLHLKKAVVDKDSFLGCPSLENLTLDCCELSLSHGVFKVNIPRLSVLTILSRDKVIKRIRLELLTPRLRFFSYRGASFLSVEAEFLPLFETIAISYNGCNETKRRFYKDLEKTLGCLGRAKSKHVPGSSSPIKVHIW